MALRATMSLLGLYQADPTLFDNLELPEGLELDTLRDNMICELAELEVIYPDPVFMKSAIGFWSKKQLHVWTELYETLLYDYNPIWNKDGTKTETRDLAATEDVTDGNTHSHDITSTRNLAHTDDSTTTESVFGFNSSTAADANKTVLDMDTSDTGTVRDAGSSSDNRSIDRDTTDTGTVTTVEQGNIGVTSTQSLIKEQREVVQFNVYDYIIADFRKRFCLMVY